MNAHLPKTESGSVLEALVERARSHKMTPQERFEQMVSFVSSSVDKDKAAVRAQLMQNVAVPREITDEAYVSGAANERKQIVEWLIAESDKRAIDPSVIYAIKIGTHAL